jgi:hypothetical protein
MAVMPKPTDALDLTGPDPELFSVEIGLFDEADQEDNHRVVPLARYLHELRNPATQPR